MPPIARRLSHVEPYQRTFKGRVFNVHPTDDPECPYHLHAAGIGGNWKELRRITPGSTLLKAWDGTREMSSLGVFTDVDGPLRLAEPHEYAGSNTPEMAEE